MSNHEATEMKAAPSADFSKLTSPFGLVGALLTVGMMAAMFNPATQHQWMGSYLFGWAFWLSVSLGAFGLTLLHHTVRGQWTLSILRFLEGMASWQNFVALLVLFIPILANPTVLYEWADPSHVTGDAVLMRKAWFLQTPAWQIRIAFVLLSFALMAWGFRNSAMRQEKSHDFKLESGRSSWGAASLVYFFLASTLLWTDVGMSLEPHWSSTMYGPWQLIAGAGAALAFCITLLCINANNQPFDGIITKKLTRDIGNMMFAFTMLWGYTTVSQFLIIWNGNLPEFTSYFSRRSSAIHPPGMEANHWGALGLLLILGKFFIPFFVLLAPRVKAKPERLMKITGFIFVIHFFDIMMLIIPSLSDRVKQGPINPMANLTDLVAWLAVGSIWIAMFSMKTKKATLLPGYDHRLQEAKAHVH
jgi:hypothetical protein